MKRLKYPAPPSPWLSPPLRNPLLASLLLTTLFVLGIELPSVQLFRDAESYLPVHITLEFIAISISMMIFTLGWNVRNEQETDNLPVLGGIFLAVALIDLAHTLSYAGMPPLVTSNSAEKSLNFWLIARLVASTSLLALAFLPTHHKPYRHLPQASLILGLTITCIVWFIGIYRVEWLPRTFIPGEGLTLFKITAEYVFVVMCVVSSWQFVRRALYEEDVSLAWLAAATWTLGLAELFFTIYQTFIDQLNLFGHLFKAIGYLMIYRALFVGAVRRPYAQLSKANAAIENALQESRIAASAFNVQEGVMITDVNNKILRVNKSFTRLTGYRAEEVIGKEPSLLHSERHDAKFYQTMNETLLRRKYWSGEIWSKRKDGTTYPKRLTISAVTDTAGEISHYVASFSDISQSREDQENIHRLAFFDPLTDLPNRRLLLDRLQQAIAVSTRNRRHGAILFIDLDNFKALNDLKGHEVGDLMLIEVARRLKNALRKNDTVARLGGDEFVVVLEGLSESVTQAIMQAKLVGEKICKVVSKPYSLNGHEYHSTTSIGITVFHSSEVSVEDLLRHADTAMHQSKQSGRDTLRFFDPSMQAALEARAALETDLRRALAGNQLKLFYQSQVDVNRQILGAEVLLRWQHPERGLVPPMQFIPLAEETGLILPIGHYVLETACLQLKKWEAAPHTKKLTLAVNVSARQLRQPDFVDEMEAMLTRTGARPNRLKIELTESMVMDNVDATIQKMERLKSLGVSFSLDDFGTGYSSLSYLKRLPLNQLKIDQSFVRDIATNPNGAIIVKTTIGMANTLALDVIAEGVETEDQLALLKQYDCPAFQGYLFSKPIPLAEFEELLDKKTSKVKTPKVKPALTRKR